MIALAVVAIGLVAASSSIATITANGIYLRDKTLGHWIAMNKLAELRLGETQPATGKSDDDIDYAGLLRRVDLTVARKDKDDEHVVARLAGFVGPPRIGGGMPTAWTGNVAGPGAGPGEPVPGDEPPAEEPPPEDGGDDDSGGDEDTGDTGAEEE
jgi:general secretion pathway protein I